MGAVQSQDTTWLSARGSCQNRPSSQVPHPLGRARAKGECAVHEAGVQGDSIGRWGLRGCTPSSPSPLPPFQAACTVLRAGPQPRPDGLQEEPRRPRAHEPHHPDAGAPGTRGHCCRAGGLGGQQTALTWVEAGSTVHSCVSPRGSLNLSVPVRSPALSELVCGGCIWGCAHRLPLCEMARWLCVAELVCFVFFFFSQDCIYLLERDEQRERDEQMLSTEPDMRLDLMTLRS